MLQSPGVGTRRPHNFGTPSYAHEVWPRSIKFGNLVIVGKGISRGTQSYLHFKEAGSSFSQFMGHMTTTITQNYQFLRDNTYGEG